MAEYSWEDPREVIAALFTLFERQTQDEQQIGTTVYQNSVGFNAIDAGILTSFCNQISLRKAISEKQIGLTRTLIKKYTKQLSFLERSTNPLVYEAEIYKAAEKPNDGILSTNGKSLFFFPKVFPSVQIKTIGNFFWRGKEVGWEGPLNEPQIEAVIRMFPTTLIDPTVEEYIEWSSKQIEMSTSVHESTLFPGQKRTTAALLKCKRGMAALRPGLGKTAAAVFAANELDKLKYDAILVVCPLTLVNNWKNEIKKWIGANAVIWHGKVEGWEPYERWIITNYETVARNTEDIINQEFKVVILDETILIKNRKAVRTKACKEITKNVPYVWLLSGSPTSHFLDDMWSQLNIIDPKRFSSYWKFAGAYCLQEVSQWGTSIVGNQEGANERILRDLRDIYFTADESEFPVIPEWVFDEIRIPMSKSQYKLYDEMEREFLATLPNDDEVLAPNVLTQLLRLTQFASNPLLLDGPDDSNKWKAVEEMLEFEQGPFIIWANFKKTASLMAQRLEKKYRVAMLTGDTPSMERQAIVDDMQNGKLQVIVAHPAVGKFGLTLTKVHTAIYLERSFSGDDYYQSLYRIRRIGTTVPPHVILLMSSRPNGDEMTVDDTINKVLEYRKNNSVALTSGMISRYLGK